MEHYEEFAAGFDGSYENSLPRELTEQYDIIECLSATEGCDTLLVQGKQGGQQAVAKCYAKRHISFDHEEAARMQEAGEGKIPRYIGEYKNEDYRCILREYIPGVSLAEYAKTNSMTTDVILDFAFQLVKIMQALHTLNPPVIHRDIKPQNIIVRPDHTLALIDFGSSRIYKKGETSDTIFSGTEDFAAPEQYGFMQTDIRSDIYSFGVVLAWMLTGKAKPIKNPKTHLERVAAKCCAFSPKQRYKNDGALLRDLHRAEPQNARRRKWAAACLAVVLVLVVGGCFYIGKNRKPELSFEEPLIEDAVRTVLGKPEGELTEADLEAVTELYIHSDNVYTTQDAYYTGSNEWQNENHVLGPIEDISDLTRMPHLKKVFIGANRIQDLTPLRELTELEEVEMANNQIVDMSPLEGMETLIHVGLMQNSLKNVDALGTLPYCSNLDLNSTGSYDASAIGELADFSFLGIFNDSDAYLYLDGKNVTQLHLGAAGQTDLECIRNMASVESLYIRWSEISDISAIEGREDIIYLNIVGCSIEDLSPLYGAPNLETVEMSESMRPEMEALAEEMGAPDFTVNYLE